MAENVGATFLDLTDVFDGVDGQVFTDYAHLTPLGNRLVAARIAERIAPSMTP
jgi:lysophospholipase L1-like esterase